MSAVMMVAPAESVSFLVPLFSRYNSHPCSNNCLVIAELIVPVPPINSTFMIHPPHVIDLNKMSIRILVSPTIACDHHEDK
ncbi:hypothetical protein D3C76_1377870 [compost metagenome]